MGGGTRKAEKEMTTAYVPRAELSAVLKSTLVVAVVIVLFTIVSVAMPADSKTV